jgi:hypothetical protein
VYDLAGGIVEMIRELPVGAWPAFLERFGSEHRAWLATIHVTDHQHGVARFTDMPLQSATLAGDAIRFGFLGHCDGLCARHAVAARAQETKSGAVIALEVETLGGRFIRLAFRAAAPPELPGGRAAGESPVDPAPAERQAPHVPAQAQSSASPL